MSVTESLDAFRSRRRLRMRRHRRRAYIRSVQLLPSLATLGNAVCGFGAMYVVTMGSDAAHVGTDPVMVMFSNHRFLVACYLILLAMVFDALDGRLARWARHTTDFGGQLDSMADVISFGAAPAMIALALFKDLFNDQVPGLPWMLSRAVWAIGAIYMSCAAIRLARFNVSNEHGEQHHMSFLGLPSPGAAAAVVGLVLIQQDLYLEWQHSSHPVLRGLVVFTTSLLPPVVLASGLLMTSGFRFPHLINKYLRGRRTFGRLIFALILVGLLVTAHRYTIGVAAIGYAISAPVWWVWLRWRSRGGRPVTAPET
jgi:CDP-diacylglycerol--serine O-phosphatidyltransferase